MTILSAQSKTDEDYDKLMKSVGAANGAMRKAADPKAASEEAAKLVALFKDAQQFWTARNNKEAADWAGVGDDARRRSAESRRGRQRRRRRGARQGARRHLQACHAKYREKTETGFAIKKRLTSCWPMALMASACWPDYLMMAAIAIATPPSVFSVTLIVSPALG